MRYSFQLDSPSHVKMEELDPIGKKTVKRETAESLTSEFGAELLALQELLYASATHSVLIVLQAMDTGGKDGTINHVFDYINPQGCSVAAFKQPTPIELAHDFLWRAHIATPPKGTITIFNRSHYEDVLVTRVHNLVPKEEWESRYERIVEFERLLATQNTIILKFYIHITKDEQEQRLLAREEDPDKSWKLSAADWHERSFWDDYMRAYEDVLAKTAQTSAPWFVIPGNRKWYRNLAIAEAIVTSLKPYKDDWRKHLRLIGKQRIKELAEMRAASPAS